MTDGGLDEIRKIFEEECIEGLDTMEAGLLNLDTGSAGIEVVHDIFRAAHSIKGGAATFGYKQIADFTHLMETMMDLVRNGEKAVTPPVIQLLLGCVDCLREMMEAIHTGDYNESRIKSLMRDLQAELPGEDGKPAPAPAAAEPAKARPAEGWRVSFRPHQNMLQSGNQPLHILRALGELGEMTVRSDVSRLPGFDALDPELIFVGWE